MQRNVNPRAQRKHSSGPRNGISKAQGYLVGLFTAKHDLQHMVVAHGSKQIRDWITEIENEIHAERERRKHG